MEAGERESGKQRQKLRCSAGMDVTQIERKNLTYRNKDGYKMERLTKRLPCL